MESSKKNDQKRKSDILKTFNDEKMMKNQKTAENHMKNKKTMENR